MKTIKVLKSKTDALALLKFIRHYQSEWTLFQCMSWVKDLPQELGAFDKYSFNEVFTRISEIAEVEVTGELEQEENNYYTKSKPIEVIEAEEWMSSLSENDQNKINILIDHARQTSIVVG